LVLLVATACATTPAYNSSSPAATTATATSNAETETTKIVEVAITKSGSDGVALVPLYFARDYASISNYTAFAEQLCQALHRFGLNSSDVCLDVKGVNGRVKFASSDYGRAIVATVAVSSTVIAKAVHQAVRMGIVVRQGGEHALFIALGNPPSPASNGSGTRYESAGPPITPADTAPMGTSAAAAVVPLAASLAVVAVLLVVVAVGLVVSQRRRPRGRRDGTNNACRGQDGICIIPNSDPTPSCEDCCNRRHPGAHLDKDGSPLEANAAKNSARPKLALPKFPEGNDCAGSPAKNAEWYCKFAVSTTQRPASKASNMKSTLLQQHSTPRRSTQWDSTVDITGCPFSRTFAVGPPSSIVARRYSSHHHPVKRAASAKSPLPDIADIPDIHGVTAEDHGRISVGDTEIVLPRTNPVNRCSYVSLAESTASRSAESMYSAVLPAVNGEVDAKIDAFELVWDDSAAPTAMKVKDQSAEEIVCSGALTAVEYISLDNTMPSSLEAACSVFDEISHIAQSASGRPFSGLHDGHAHNAKLVQTASTISPARTAKDKLVGEAFSIGINSAHNRDIRAVVLTGPASPRLGSAEVQDVVAESHWPQAVDRMSRLNVATDPNPRKEKILAAEQGTGGDVFVGLDKPEYENAHAFRMNMRRRGCL